MVDQHSTFWHFIEEHGETVDFDVLSPETDAQPATVRKAMEQAHHLAERVRAARQAPQPTDAESEEKREDFLD